MNRLISLQITDSEFRLTMLSMVYDANIEAVDNESDNGRGATLLTSQAVIMTKYCPPSKTTKGDKYSFETLAYPPRPQQ